MLRYTKWGIALMLVATAALAQVSYNPPGRLHIPKNYAFKSVAGIDSVVTKRLVADAIGPPDCPPQAICITAVAATAIDSHSVAVSRGHSGLAHSYLRVWDGDVAANFTNNLSDDYRNVRAVIGVIPPGVSYSAGDTCTVVVGGSSRWRVPVAPASADETSPWLIRYNGSSTVYYVSQTLPDEGHVVYAGGAGDEEVVSGDANKTDLYMRWSFEVWESDTRLKLTQAASSLACNPTNLTNIYYDTDDNYAKMCKVLATGSLLGATTTSTTKVGLASRAQAVAFPSSGTAFIGNDAFAYTGKSLSDSSLTGVTGADTKSAGSTVKAIGYSNIAADDDGDGVVAGFDWDDRDKALFGRSVVYSGTDFHKTISGVDYIYYRPFDVGKSLPAHWADAYWNITKFCFEKSPDNLGAWVTDTYGPIVSNLSWWSYSGGASFISPFNSTSDGRQNAQTTSPVNSMTCREIAMP